MKYMPTNFGVKVDSNNIDDWYKAGFDWGVERKQLATIDGTPVEGKVALVNSKTGKPLGIVSDRYKVVQPIDMLDTFSIAVNRMGFTMETLGMYNHGQIIWGRAAMHESFKVAANDEVNYYMYFATSMDGSLATHAFISTLRVLCMNALNVAHKKAEMSLNVRHSTDYSPSMFSDAAEGFTTAKEEFENKVRVLKEYEFDSLQDFNHTFIELYDQLIEKEPEDDKKLERWRRRVSNLYSYTMYSEGSREAGRTLWAILNGYTYMIDHESRCRSLEAAHKNSVFGIGSKKKSTFMDGLVEFAEAA